MGTSRLTLTDAVRVVSRPSCIACIAWDPVCTTGLVHLAQLVHLDHLAHLVHPVHPVHPDHPVHLVRFVRLVRFQLLVHIQASQWWPRSLLVVVVHRSVHWLGRKTFDRGLRHEQVSARRQAEPHRYFKGFEASQESRECEESDETSRGGRMPYSPVLSDLPKSDDRDP
jgi:hypothetical protein